MGVLGRQDFFPSPAHGVGIAVLQYLLLPKKALITWGRKLAYSNEVGMPNGTG